MTEFSIQSTVRIDTTQAHQALAQLGQDYDALRQRMMQPIPVTVNAGGGGNNGGGNGGGGNGGGPAAPTGGGPAVFQLDTAEAQRRLSQLSQDYEALRQRILQPVAVNLILPQGLQDAGGQQDGQQGAPVAIDTTQARQALEQLGQDYDALRQRMIQPIPVTVNTGGGGNNGGGPAAPTGGGSVTFHLDTDEARRRISQLSQDYETLRQRILQPVAVNIEIPQELQNTAGQQGGQQGTPVAIDTTQAHQALALLLRHFEAVRQRMMQPIPVTVNVNAGGGGNGGGGPAAPTGGGPGSGHGFLDAVGVVLGTVWTGIRRVWSIVNFAWSGVKFLIGGVGSFFSMIGRGITSLATTPFRLLTSAIHGVAGAFSLMRTAAQSVMSLLQPAGDLQQRAMNMEVLLKDKGKARARLEELERYAKETNFNPGEVIEASNLMQAFGIHGNDLTRLKLAGDAANAFGKDIREVVTALNYLGSGRGGEAFEALSRIGVTRDKLKTYGVQFNSQGALVTDAKKALKAVFQYFKDNFNGATERQAKTWKGALQQASGEVTYALSHGLMGALKPFTAFVSKSIIPAISRIGDSLKKIDWKKTLTKPLGTLKKIVDTVSSMGSRAIDPRTRGNMFAELKILGTGLLESGRLVADGLMKVGKGLLMDLGATLENFTKNGVFPALASTFWNMGKTVLFGFLDAGRLVLSGFSDKFKSDMLVMFDKVFGKFGIDTGETDIRNSAELQAKNRVLDDVREGKFGNVLRVYYNQYETVAKKKEIEGYKKAVIDYLNKTAKKRRIGSYDTGIDAGTDKLSELMGNIKKAGSIAEISKLLFAYDDRGIKSGAFKAMNDHQINNRLNDWEWASKNPVLQKAFEEELARIMGWSDGSTKKFESMAAGALKDAEKSLKDTINGASMSISTKHIEAAGKKLINETLPAAAAPLNAFIGEQQAQAKLKGNFNKANDWADERLAYIDKELKRREKEYKRAKKNGSSSDTLAGMDSVIQSLNAEKTRITTWQQNLEKRYVNASNAQSMRYQRQERQRQRRPASPGMQQEGQPRQSREAASVGNIELNTASTAKNIVLLAGAINRFLTRQNGLEKTLQQVLEA